MQSATVGLVAHVMTIGLLLALIMAIGLASKEERTLNWRYWRLLCAVLATWTLWFFFLSISTKGTELLTRDTLAWTLRTLELTGSVMGWIWLVMTLRVSFRITRRRPARPAAISMVSGD